MEKIAIQNGKVLRLANVLIKKLYSITLLELDEAINQMMQFIDANMRASDHTRQRHLCDSIW